MIGSILDLVCLFVSASRIVPLPGVPVSIHPVGGGIAVSCIDPPSICLVDSSFTIETLPLDVVGPRELCFWNDGLVAADFAGGTISAENRLIPVPGSPDGICEVYWNSSSVPELAAALFDPGIVVLVKMDGSISTLIEMSGVKSLSSCDADGDGDMDIFASGCGTGVVLIENQYSLPVVHEIGTIQAGVKKCSSIDMDGDGNTDVAGIACAEGGVGWWRNPGRSGEKWRYQEIDGSLEGPKDIFCRGDSFAVASLFSEGIISWRPDVQIPSGFTCCCISEDGGVIFGHRLGFLVFLPAAPR